MIVNPIGHTRIGEFEVPVVGQAPVVRFTSGRNGPHEAGFYGFWEVVLKEPRQDILGVVVSRRVFRQRIDTPVGERIERFETDANDESMPPRTRDANLHVWLHEVERGANVACIEAATETLVSYWLSVKPADAQFAEWAGSIARRAED